MKAVKGTLLFIGAAEGFGEALVTQFCREGYNVVGLSRSDRNVATLTSRAKAEGREYRHVCADLTDIPALNSALAPMCEEFSVVVHNAHQVSFKGFLDYTTDEFRSMWEIAVLGVSSILQQTLPAMVRQGSGTIIFSGATASLRGGARSSAFSASKFALRALAQSLAREFSGKGIHVVHTVLDGLIDEPQSEQRFGIGQSQRMSASALAQEYVNIVRQPSNVWTHEIDYRPFSEKF